MVNPQNHKKNNTFWGGAWASQSVKCPALDVSSGHDLMARETEPHNELCADSVEPAWDSLSLSAPPLHTHMHAFSLSLSLSLSLSKEINKH